MLPSSVRLVSLGRDDGGRVRRGDRDWVERAGGAEWRRAAAARMHCAAPRGDPSAPRHHARGDLHGTAVLDVLDGRCARARVERGGLADEAFGVRGDRRTGWDGRTLANSLECGDRSRRFYSPRQACLEAVCVSHVARSPAPPASQSGWLGGLHHFSATSVAVSDPGLAVLVGP